MAAAAHRRWGRYRRSRSPVPLMVVGFCAVTVEPDERSARSLDMVILGLGIGLVCRCWCWPSERRRLPRPRRGDLGATFFRSIGGCFGVAICGAIFSNRLGAELAGPDLPPRGSWATSRRSGRQLPRGRWAVRRRYADALNTVFLVCAPVAAVAFVPPGCCPRNRCGARSRRPASARPSPRPSTRTRRRRSSARSRRWRGAIPAAHPRAPVRRRALSSPRASAGSSGAWARTARRTPWIADRHSVDAARVAGAWPSCATSATWRPQRRDRASEAGREALDGSSPRVASAWPSCSTAGRPRARPSSPSCSRAGARPSSTIPTVLRGPRGGGA